jgi:hypothetical protein
MRRIGEALATQYAASNRGFAMDPNSGSSAALGQVQPLLPAISSCGAGHLSGESRRFRKLLSRRPIGDSPWPQMPDLG